MAANYDRNDRWNRRDSERYNPNDRGALERGADEVRSWFGDNDAERRRNIDERRDDLRNRSSYDSDRGALERGADEVRSWFGDNDAERRRNIDERRDDLRDRNRYDSNRYNSYGTSNERGPLERGADEVRSWFGDNDAERRRNMDERRDDLRDRTRYNSYGGNERGPLERGADEVRSWFGDNDAERRRNMDERRDDLRQRYDYDHGSDYRHNYGNQRYDSDRVRTDLNSNSGTGSYGTPGGGYNRPAERRDDSLYNRSGYGSYGTPSGSGSSYGSSANYGHNSGYRSEHERGFLERAGDEVRSWFGDDDAERRRRMDTWRDAGYRTDNDDDRRNRGW